MIRISEFTCKATWKATMVTSVFLLFGGSGIRPTGGQLNGGAGYHDHAGWHRFYRCGGTHAEPLQRGRRRLAHH